MEAILLTYLKLGDTLKLKLTWWICDIEKLNKTNFWGQFCKPVVVDTKINIGPCTIIWGEKKKKWANSLKSKMEEIDSCACGHCQIDVFYIT